MDTYEGSGRSDVDRDEDIRQSDRPREIGAPHGSRKPNSDLIAPWVVVRSDNRRVGA